MTEEQKELITRWLENIEFLSEYSGDTKEQLTQINTHTKEAIKYLNDHWDDPSPEVWDAFRD